MYLYRVDKRYFEVGAEIQPQTNFEQYMDEESMKVENILNANRPVQIPLRKDCLFLFFELSAALNFFRKYGGYVYEVEVDCHDIYHRGDMNKLDNLLDLVRFTDEVDILTAAGNEYWKGGTHTFMPCYEYLVKSCIVRKCLVEPSELKSFTDNFEITKSTNSDFPEVGEPVTTAKCEVIHLIFSSSSEIPSFFPCGNPLSKYASMSL